MNYKVFMFFFPFLVNCSNTLVPKYIRMKQNNQNEYNNYTTNSNINDSFDEEVTIFWTHSGKKKKIKEEKKSMLSLSLSNDNFFDSLQNIFLPKTWKKKDNKTRIHALKIEPKPKNYKKYEGNWDNIEKKGYKTDYWFLSFLATKIISLIEQYEFDTAKTYLEKCRSHKIHLFTRKEFHQQKPQTEKSINMIRKALVTTKRNIIHQKVLPRISKIIAYIHKSQNNQKQEHAIIKEKTIGSMKNLYEIALRLHNLHQENFEKIDLNNITITQDNFLQFFLPHYVVLLKNIKVNPSLTTKEYSNLNINDLITF